MMMMMMMMIMMIITGFSSGIIALWDLSTRKQEEIYQARLNIHPKLWKKNKHFEQK